MACVMKKRGKWWLDFYDQHGKRHRQPATKGKNKKDAEDELLEIRNQIGKGTYRPIKEMPTFSKVAGDWIQHKKAYLRANTWDVYQGHVNNHFDDLNGLLVNQVTTATIEQYITTRIQRGMNIVTLRKVLVSLNQIMKYAVRHRYIDYNPLADAERPRTQGDEKDSKDKITILSRDQVKSFLAEVEHPMYRVLFMVAVFSGARQGEILGLKWSDMDWNNNQIHFQRTFNNGRFYATKTKKSNRRVDIGPMTMQELKKWKLGCPANDLGLVFPNDAGGPINYSNMVQRHFQPALDAAGIPRIRFHDVRHTYASIQLDRGENMKYVQTQLGHSSPTVTWNVYAHRMKPVNQDAARALEEDVLGKKWAPNGHQPGKKTKKKVAA